MLNNYTCAEPLAPEGSQNTYAESVPPHGEAAYREDMTDR
ncbi:hypothetical protein CLOM621_05347 [Clostridium sp. M62/1]|nr:hypothetical protein CLOM621_05347 [Clostridium sp. M62/1]